MTSLLEPDMGEVLDRLSILDLKIEAGMRRGVSTQGWEEERRKLTAYMTNKLQVLQSGAKGGYWDAFQTANADLQKVNWKLWQTEDEIRRYSSEPGGNWPEGTMREIVILAMRIVDLNDTRSKLVQQINGLFGVETQEKIYVQ